MSDKDKLRVAIVAADDAYASSVADAAAATAASLDMPVVQHATYSLLLPDWQLPFTLIKPTKPMPLLKPPMFG